MNAVFVHRRFWLGLLSVTGIVLLSEGSVLVRMHRDAERATARWKAKLHERGEYRLMTPAPTKESADRLDLNLAAARLALAQTAAKLQTDEASLASEESESRSASVTSTDAFFELAAFVARMRQTAEKNGVTLKRGERFGFSTYAEEPPATELASPVLRQTRFAETILVLLFEARPESLVSFQREPLSLVSAERAGANRTRTTTPASSGASADYFIIDPQRSLRRAGVVEATAFRLVFTGATGTLRSFLNRLADAPLPLVVRSVEVTCTGSEALPGSPRQMERSASTVLGGDAPKETLVDSVPVAVIVPTVSTYTVVVEVVNFMGKISGKVSEKFPVFG